MATKRITDVDIIDSLNSNESFFVNQNSTIKQINKSNIVFGINNGGTGATTIAGARNALGLGNTDGALPIANGGTGATTVAGVRDTLGLGNTDGALPIANGGTGATDAVMARANIGAVTMNNTTVELIEGGWENNQQTVTVDYVTANNIVIAGADASTDNYQTYIECGIRCIGQTEGELTFLCDDIPSTTVTVNVVVFS